MKTQQAIWERSGIPFFHRGMNFGNFLDFPVEGEQTEGLLIQDEWFPLLKQTGFDCIRLPIRWSSHAGTEPPYIIDDVFLARITHLVDQAMTHGLVMIINQHHYAALMQDPARHRDRFVALWAQIARRFRKYPENLFIELLNEPMQQLTAALWDKYWPEAYRAVRHEDSSRVIICGPPEWNDAGSLDGFSLTPGGRDKKLMGTFHYYEPHPFTHQGAPWVKPPHPLGSEWTGTPEQVAAVRRDMDTALAWAEKEGRPLFMGEFGAYPKISPHDQVIRWTTCVRTEAEKRAIPWCYWEFCHGFGVWDRKQKEFKKDLLNALIG